MPTARQIMANRPNSTQSSGPRTAECKTESRGRALKHEMAGAGTVLLEARADEVERRVAGWPKSLRSRDEYERYFIAHEALQTSGPARPPGSPTPPPGATAAGGVPGLEGPAGGALKTRPAHRSIPRP